MTTNAIALILFACAIVFSIVHVWMMRAKAQGQIKPDKLSAGERILILVVGIVGGILPTGVIYYAGLKKLFPTKAWQIAKMFIWVMVAVVIWIVAVAAFNIYQLRQARQEAGKAFDRVQDMQRLLEEAEKGNAAL